MESLSQWISQYGYPGLFVLLVLGIVGLPVPDETLLVFSGYLIAKGHWHPLVAFAWAFGGSACGISVSYVLGRTFGHAAVERYGRYIHLTPARVERVHEWFRRFGNWLLSAGYFIPGVRHFTALVAGMSGLEFRIFAPFAYFGAAVWVTFFLSLGYWFGENWRSIVLLTHRLTLPVIAVCCVAAAILWALRSRANRRAKASASVATQSESRD
jgi:membrane protein DedA with SNARE-associated domain